MWCGGDTLRLGRWSRARVATNLLRGPRPSATPAMDPRTAPLALEPDVIFLPDEPYTFHSRRCRGHSRDVEQRASSARSRDNLFTWHGTRTTLGPCAFLRQSFAVIAADHRPSIGEKIVLVHPKWRTDNPVRLPPSFQIMD